MNEQSNNYQKIQFKNWIKKRFISELDINSISVRDALLWVEVLRELSIELIDTVIISRLTKHEIVPFRREKG